jgi:14-3-3 protein epsilon
LVLNYSVFLDEIAGEKQTAVELAKKTYEECGVTVANNSKDSFGEATNILQLLRENVAIWSQTAD